MSIIFLLFEIHKGKELSHIVHLVLYFLGHVSVKGKLEIRWYHDAAA